MAVVDAEPARLRNRLAPPRRPRRGEQDLLLEGDVAEEPFAESAVCREVDPAGPGRCLGEDGVEPGVILGQELEDGSGHRRSPGSARAY